MPATQPPRDAVDYNPAEQFVEEKLLAPQPPGHTDDYDDPAKQFVKEELPATQPPRDAVDYNPAEQFVEEELPAHQPSAHTVDYGDYCIDHAMCRSNDRIAAFCETIQKEFLQIV